MSGQFRNLISEVCKCRLEAMKLKQDCLMTKWALFIVGACLPEGALHMFLCVCLFLVTLLTIAPKNLTGPTLLFQELISRDSSSQGIILRITGLTAVSGQFGVEILRCLSQLY